MKILIFVIKSHCGCTYFHPSMCVIIPRIYLRMPTCCILIGYFILKSFLQIDPMNQNSPFCYFPNSCIRLWRLHTLLWITHLVNSSTSTSIKFLFKRKEKCLPILKIGVCLLGSPPCWISVNLVLSIQSLVLQFLVHCHHVIFLSLI